MTTRVQRTSDDIGLDLRYAIPKEVEDKRGEKHIFTFILSLHKMNKKTMNHQGGESFVCYLPIAGINWNKVIDELLEKARRRQIARLVASLKTQSPQESRIKK